ncbi:MAG: DNA alkylation repair protein [Patescibacteria group bacterium]|nr:DNA alkylation repair protein [Patescibacteria group bacterium]MDD5121162.1 DNA alkylation repair protein [Patescibacteria group bacterium]MDD5221677.1 DNA alkylation repair protein [Patescibacteria group bacterium]MDD5395919.1 DNA alkylation repair protein [Patescibacteria group bacterium]
MLNKIKKDFLKAQDKKKAKLLAGFFKTGKGQYGEGDVFLGIIVPKQRAIAKKYSDLSLINCQKLLKSKIHEYRLTALLILVGQYKKSDWPKRKKIFDFYCRNFKYINNWDLVDLSAPNITGHYLYNQSGGPLIKRWIKSDHLWTKRIGLLSTAYFIKNKQFNEILSAARLLLKDRHDLIHKASGWMLREAGKKDGQVLTKFLDQNFRQMPRTMLRYAIEKFPEKKRQHYLKTSK